MSQCHFFLQKWYPLSDMLNIEGDLKCFFLMWKNPPFVFPGVILLWKTPNLLCKIPSSLLQQCSAVEDPVFNCIGAVLMFKALLLYFTCPYWAIVNFHGEACVRAWNDHLLTHCASLGKLEIMHCQLKAWPAPLAFRSSRVDFSASCICLSRSAQPALGRRQHCLGRSVTTVQVFMPLREDWPVLRLLWGGVSGTIPESGAWAGQLDG